MANDPIQGRLTGDPHEVVQALIFERRSIRKYQNRPLPEAWIEAMLRCAHQAPSPSNRQPVRMVRIESPSARQRLKQALDRGHQNLMERHRTAGGAARLRNRINVYRRYADFMFDAPVLLAVGVCTDTRGFMDYLREGGLVSEPVASSSDLDITVGLALQGLMLEARALGVGSCILTAPLAFIDRVEDLLGLASLKIKCFLTLGMPDESPEPSRRLPLDAVVQVI